MLQTQITKWENLTDLGLTRPNQATQRIQLDMDLTKIVNHLTARTSRHFLFLFRCATSVTNSYDCEEI